MKSKYKKNLISLVIAIISAVTFCYLSEAKLKSNEQSDEKELLTDITHINITGRIAKNIEAVEKLVKEKRPKAIYIEQWILAEKGNENLAQKLHKIAHKNEAKFYLFVGRDNWFGRRGLVNVLAALDQYGNDIDGIVLKTQPNKTNIWKNSTDFQAQLLNQMLDAYSAIHTEAKRRNKLFIADFPFWFSDYNGPKKSFSENVCDYTDKVIFLIDDLTKLKSLNINWNDITCLYSIDLTKHATQLSDDDVSDMYKTIKSKLTFYSNFNGFIVDSSSNIDFKELEKQAENTSKEQFDDSSDAKPIKNVPENK